MGKKAMEMHRERMLFHEAMLGVLDKNRQNFSRDDSDVYVYDHMNDLWWTWVEARNCLINEIEEKEKEVIK